VHNGAVEWLISFDFLRGNEGDLYAFSWPRFGFSVLVTINKEINSFINCKIWYIVSIKAYPFVFIFINVFIYLNSRNYRN